MKTRIHVKPDGDGWGIYKFNIWQNFTDDIEKFGVGMAIRNFLYLTFARPHND